jgi:hypothetical protein
VRFRLTSSDLAYWNNGWTVAPGAYQIYVGDSSALSGLPLQGTLTVR